MFVILKLRISCSQPTDSELQNDRKKRLIELLRDTVFCHSEGNSESGTISQDSESYLPEVKDLAQNDKYLKLSLTPQFLIEPKKNASGEAEVDTLKLYHPKS